MFKKGIISYGRLFPPPTNCVAHYDASIGTSVHISTGVSQWDDLSGNGHHLLQASSTLQPVYSGTGLTSFITFDGSNDFMQAIAFTLNQPETLYFVGKQNWISNAKIWDGNGNFSMDWVQTGSTPATAMFAGNTGPGSSSDFSIATVKVVALVYNGSSSTLIVNNGTIHTGNVGASNAGGFTLGAVANGTQPSNIAVQEVYIYAAAHTTIQQAEIVGFLRSKWGV